MGLDDRDYMRDRYQERQGTKFDQTRWRDTKARVEHDGTWFEPNNRGQDYQKARWRPEPVFRPHPAQKWIFLLSALSHPVPGISRDEAWRMVPRS